MKNLLLLLSASTCFAFEAPEMKHTPLAKEIATSFARHIQPEQGPKGPCDYLWDGYNKELRKYGFLSSSAQNVYTEFLSCIKKSIEENSALLQKRTKELEDAIAEFEGKIIK